MIQPPRFRLSLRQIMALVILLSVMFAMLGVVGGSVATATLALLVGPLKLKPRSKRIEAWAWSASLYPSLLLTSVTLTWISARLVLGHDPARAEFARAYPSPLIAGAWITTKLLAFFLPLSFVICLFLAVAVAKTRSLSEQPGTPSPYRSAIGPALWLAAFAVLWWDPFRFAATLLR